MNAKRLLVMTAASLLFATAASAQTLYKLIDRNGKVTYSESKPKEFDGQVIRLDIDPNANTATLPKPTAPSAGAAARAAGAKNEAIIRLEGAQERLERAKVALQNARDNPTEGDFNFVGNAGGGTRRVPTDAYLQRLSRLEEEVRQAEEAVARGEKGR
jgi:hypothetical protein